MKLPKKRTLERAGSCLCDAEGHLIFPKGMGRTTERFSDEEGGSLPETDEAATRSVATVWKSIVLDVS